MDLKSEFERARSLHKDGRLDEAADIYQAILKQDPSLHRLQTYLAAALLEQGKIEQALRASEKTLKLDPNQPAGWANRGLALHRLARYAEALECYDKALSFDPNLIEAHHNRALALHAMRNFTGALSGIDRALARAPRRAELYSDRALILYSLDRHGEAVMHADQAIALGMTSHQPHLHRGYALYALQRTDEARAALERAIAIKPDCAEAHLALANVALDLRDFDLVSACLDRADLDDADYVPGLRLHTKMMFCDWRTYEQDWRALMRKVGDGKLASMVSFTMPIPARPAQQLKLAKLNAARAAPPVKRIACGPYRNERIKLGYFSSDFHEHATSQLIAGMIEQHDRARFEIIGFSFGPVRADAMRARLEAGFDQLINVGDASDEAIAARARAMQIDIAIDLKGWTRGGRMGVFGHGAAPVQVSYLGYPATTGADFIDYMTADEVIIPPEHRGGYSEKIVYLPGSYQANDDTRSIAPRVFTRTELGLPEEGFVFCGFNSLYKITPDVFDIWMRLLREIESSVLWLYEANDAAKHNLRKEAEARGVAPERIVFSPFIETSAHLARHAGADLFLDTFYCNAHTTAADALWAGLPVLTKPGETFAGRVAASLVSAVGLSELIAKDEQDYESIALDIARHPEKLAALKAKLAANRLTQPLFDTARFTRHIERAYEQMHARSQTGGRAEDFAVAPIG